MVEKKRSNMKTLVSWLLAICLIVTSFAIPQQQKKVFADTSEVISGKAYYPISDTKDSYVPYYYSDSYFTGSAYTYNASLATMSLCMELAAWPSSEEKDFAKKSRNAEKLYSEIGFTDFEVNEGFKKRPTKDSIGVAMANKKIQVGGEEYTLVSIAVRGGGYGAEWVGNLTVGESGEHTGFSSAASQVFSFANQYMKKHVSGKVKLWIVGYSRGGATAGLTAKRYDDYADKLNAYFGLNVSLSRDDIYTYTFEAPRGADRTQVENFSSQSDSAQYKYSDGSTKPEYQNIKNIVNPADPVPKVVMSYWGCTRPGQDYWIPTYETDRNYEKKHTLMRQNLASLPNKVTEFDSVDAFRQAKNKSQGVFMDQVLRHLGEDRIGSRKNYCQEKNYQETWCYVANLVLGNANYSISQLADAALQGIKNNIGSMTAKALLLGIFFGTTSIASNISDNVYEGLMTLNIPGLAEQEEEFNNAFDNIVGLVARMAFFHLSEISTLYSWGSSIGNTHQPEICMAWLMTADKNYQKKSARLMALNEASDGTETTGDAAEAEYTAAGYREVHVTAVAKNDKKLAELTPQELLLQTDKTTLLVFDTDRNLLAKVAGEEVCEVTGSSIVASASNGEQTVYLPMDEEYQVAVAPNPECNVTLSINEYSYDSAKEAKLINVYNEVLESDETLFATLGATEEKHFADGSDAEYQIGGEEVAMDLEYEEFSVATVSEASVTIETEVNNEEYGVVSNEEHFTKGRAAVITATAAAGYKFDGWYYEGTKISSDEELHMLAAYDMKLTAVFTEDTNAVQHNVTVENGSGSGSYYEEGLAVIKADPAPEGKVFDKWVCEDGQILAEKQEEAAVLIEDKDVVVTATYKDIVYGDLNYDGVVSLEDAQMALKAALKIVILPAKKTLAADVDKDSQVTLEDAQKILRAALRIEAL